MSVEAQIRQAAARNAELVQVLHDTESAVPDLAAQQDYVADLERQAAEAAERLRQLGERRRRELRAHESYRDSVLRRFAYKLGGREERFAARAAREEREYFDALQEEHRAGARAAGLAALLADARAARAALEGPAATHAAAQAALDGLHEAIFAGPTPGCPEEDARERAAGAARRAYREARARAGGEAQAVRALAAAGEHLARAAAATGDALRASRRDVLGGGTFRDMLERNALARAEDEVQQARGLVAAARRAAPLVRELPGVSVAQGSLLGDVFFDNYASDVAFHDEIRQSNLEVQRCAQAVKADLAAARRRHAELARETETKRAEVRETRTRLQRAREAAFERIAAQTGTGTTLPPGADGASADNWWE